MRGGTTAPPAVVSELPSPPPASPSAVSPAVDTLPRGRRGSDHRGGDWGEVVGGCADSTSSQPPSRPQPRGVPLVRCSGGQRHEDSCPQRPPLPPPRAARRPLPPHSSHSRLPPPPPSLLPSRHATGGVWGTREDRCGGHLPHTPRRPPPPRPHPPSEPHSRRPPCPPPRQRRRVGGGATALPAGAQPRPRRRSRVRRARWRARGAPRQRQTPGVRPDRGNGAQQKPRGIAVVACGGGGESGGWLLLTSAPACALCRGCHF